LRGNGGGAPCRERGCGGGAAFGVDSAGRGPGRALVRNAVLALEGVRVGSGAPREASRARWAASDSTLRTASSSDSRSRVISDSLSGGSTLRSCAINAARARS
jgi:hypothetical protein